MFGLNPMNQNQTQNRPFMPFGGFQQQGGQSYFPQQQWSQWSPFLNSSFFNNRSQFPFGALSMFNNNSRRMGLGQMSNVMGHVMNGYSLIKTVAPLVTRFW